MRRPPAAVFLLALVLAAMTGGATAFAVMNKTVRLDVDGRHLSVRTFAGDVAGALRNAGVVVGAHDQVDPPLDAHVHDGSTIVVRHGRLLHLLVGGHHEDEWVTALTVEGALRQLGLAQPAAWLSVDRTETIPREGMTFAVRLPQHVTVLVDGRRISRVTTLPTVRLLLRAAHVRLHRLDHVSVSLNRYPTSGLIVTIDRIRQRVVTQSVAIPFAVRHVRSSSLYVGDSKVLRYGQPGVRLNTFRLTWKNHKLVRRTLLRSKVRSHPVREVVAIGTKQRPQYWPANDGLNWSALAYCESGGNPTEVSSDGLYRGLYQFTIGTWQSVGGPGDPIDAPSYEQTYFAQQLYHRSGASAWPECGHYLYT